MKHGWLRTLAALLLLAGAAPAWAGSYFAGYYTNFHGTRYYSGYVPSSYNGSPMPLVVGLHGCTETAFGFQELTQLDDLAEQRGFIVVFPEQAYAANNGRCWNWFLSVNQARGSGEPSIIKGIVDWVKGHYSIDANRTYATGISAGGAMTVTMGTLYPDVFAAIAPHSGCGWKGLPCNTSGGGDPITRGNEIYTAMGANRRVLPVIAFIGSADAITPPINTDQIITQFAQADDRISDGSDNNNIDGVADQTVAGQVPGGRSYTRYVYKNTANNQVVLERYVVNGMAHKWSGGPGYHIYGDPAGPNASSIIYDFFLAHPK